MSNITAPQTSCNQSHRAMIGIQLKIWEWPPLTRAFPDLTLSLPHSQISEASPSCELTRWSGMGGSDPKDPSLTHPLLPSPRFLLNGTFLRFTVTEGSAGPNQCLSFVGVGRLLFIYDNHFRILHWRLSQQSHKSTDVKGATPPCPRARKSRGAWVQTCAFEQENAVVPWARVAKTTRAAHSLTVKSLPTGSHAQ